MEFYRMGYKNNQLMVLIAGPVDSTTPDRGQAGVVMMRFSFSRRLNGGAFLKREWRKELI